MAKNEQNWNKFKDKKTGLNMAAGAHVERVKKNKRAQHNTIK